MSHRVSTRNTAAATNETIQNFPGLIPASPRAALSRIVSRAAEGRGEGQRQSQQLFVAVGGPDDALARLVLVTVFDGGQSGGLTVLAPCGTGVLAVLGGCQSAAHTRPPSPHDLATAGAAFSEGDFFGAFARRLVPARAVFSGTLVPRERAVPGGCGRRRKQGVSEG